MVELDEIEKKARGISLEEILKEHDWREFEKMVGGIFEKNEFKVKRNFRFKTKKRYEIDILATKQNFVFCVDCKKWSGGRYKKSGIKAAVSEQEKRTLLVRNFLKKNPIAMQMLKIDRDTRFYSLIVTLMEEDMFQEKKTFIVPVFKLNSFLLEVEKYLD